jgi:hypothetical protein
VENVASIMWPSNRGGEGLKFTEQKWRRAKQHQTRNVGSDFYGSDDEWGAMNKIENMHLREKTWIRRCEGEWRAKLFRFCAAHMKFSHLYFHIQGFQ